MRNYKSGRGGFGRRDRDSRRFGGSRGGFGGGRGRDRGQREMHDVTCDKCGKKCQVPFKPSEDKPVLCDECFKSKGGGRGGGISPGQLEEINQKLDKILKILGPDRNEEGSSA